MPRNEATHSDGGCEVCAEITGAHWPELALVYERTMPPDSPLRAWAGRTLEVRECGAYGGRLARMLPRAAQP
jgi:hypothetical protein